MIKKWVMILYRLIIFLLALYLNNVAVGMQEVEDGFNLVIKEHVTQLTNLNRIHAPKLILFSATAGMGKTTIAKKIENELGALRITLDEGRSLMIKHFLYPLKGTEQDKINAAMNYLDKLLSLLPQISNNRFIVLDDTVDRMYLKILTIAAAHHYPTFLIRINASKETAIARIKKREQNPIGYLNNIDRWYNDYLAFDLKSIDCSIDNDVEGKEPEISSMLALIRNNKKEEAILVPAPVGHIGARIDEQTEKPIIPNILVIHYTAVSLGKTLKIFLGYDDAKVTSHYTISEDGIVFQHASEDVAAHHAGVSFWDGKTGLNRYSIGVEHVNPGYKERDDQPAGIFVSGSEKEWYPFEKKQMEASIRLCKKIVERYSIVPRNVVGHSDIAPRRKPDPGPLFPWQDFAQQGIGAWPSLEESSGLSCFQEAKDKKRLYEWLVQHLHIWGYKKPDETASAQDIIQAFQMHFRQRDISGVADEETALILNALLCKYVVSSKDCSCSNVF